MWMDEDLKWCAHNDICQAVPLMKERAARSYVTVTGHHDVENWVLNYRLTTFNMILKERSWCLKESIFPSPLERYSPLACSTLASMIISATFTARNSHDCVSSSTKPAHFRQRRTVQASTLIKWISWVVYRHVWSMQEGSRRTSLRQSHMRNCL